MNKNEWDKIKDIFAAALEQPAPVRASFVRGECGPEREICREVLSLLDAHDATAHFIDGREYSASDLLDTSADEYAGKMFGRYEVLREIGRGGMGAVFLARRSDGQFDQQVALKIVRRSFIDNELERRFRLERQILASLNHPNIARLYDGGISDSGEPFFAMEYVDGERIDDFCVRRRLNTRERLKLFLAVCSAVSFAHQNLVVHRDLKPSNILVTAEGTPKLLDFGIAKLLRNEGEGDATRTAYRAFTPEYASPEQMSGDTVTTASDVYSLGKLLAAILKADEPAGGSSPHAWRPEQAEGQADTSLAAGRSTLDGSAAGARANDTRTGLDRELTNIHLMACRDEPERRYATVAELAEDIGKYLDGRPVRAVKDSLGYRSKKFARRNKLAIGAAAIVILAVLAGTAAALWQAGVARAERDRAERRFNDLRQLSNALLFELSPKIERLPGSTEAREVLVRRALEYLDSLAAEAVGDDQLQTELARAYEKIGDLQANPVHPSFVDPEAGIASFEKARSIRLDLLERRPNDLELQKGLAENYRALGRAHGEALDHAAEGRHLESANAIYDSLIGTHPDDPDLIIAKAGVDHYLGRSRSNSDSYPASFPYFERAIESLEALRTRVGDSPDLLKTLGECYIQYALGLSWETRQDEAEAFAAKGIDSLRRAVDSNPEDTGYTSTLWLGYFLTSSIYEDVDNAVSHENAKSALAIARRAALADPANVRAKQQLAKSYSVVGQTSTNLGRIEESAENLALALEIMESIVETRTKNRSLQMDHAAVLMRLGELNDKQGNQKQAISYFERAVAVHGRILENFPQDRVVIRNLAITYESIAEIHQKLDGAKSQTAKETYAKQLHLLEGLDANNGMSEADREMLIKLRALLGKA